MALLEHTFAADGNSSSVKWHGGRDARGTVKVGPEVDFGGGTLKLQYSEDNSAWSGDTGVELTAAAQTFDTFELPPGYLRFNLSGSTSPDLAASLIAH